MISERSRVVPPSVDLHARVQTVLVAQFREYVPGRQDGFGITSHDHTEPRRMFVRWYSDVERNSPGRPPVAERMRPELVEALERAGYVVTCPPDGWDVYFADRPVDDAGPRYEAVRSDLPFGHPWLVMDRWTRVYAAVADTEEAAKEEAARRDRAQALADARKVVAERLIPHLERADEFLGDGMRWLRREVHDIARYTEPVPMERVDALVAVANVVQRGREVRQDGRLVELVAYDGASRAAEYKVQWVPQSDAPAVGYYPDPAWARSPHQEAAIAVLTAAGLEPAQFGADIGIGGYMCESEGFMVSACDTCDTTGSDVEGLVISPAGNTASEQQARVPAVMRAAGWRVDDSPAWHESWMVYPPEGTEG